MSGDKVIVIGGGVIGVTTAYESVLRGFETVLIEAEPAIATQTSFANGAMLTASMSDPWNAPGVHRHLAASLFDPTSAMKLRWTTIPSLMSWGMRFLANARSGPYRAATHANYILARYSIDVMQELRSTLALDYDASTLGTMKLFRSKAAMEGPLRLAQELVPLGLRYRQLDAGEAVAEEPALVAIEDQIAGALRFPDDETGDAHRFSVELNGKFAAAGGRNEFGARVARIAGDRSGITGVRLADGREFAGRVIVAAGTGTPDLLSRLGLRLPIQPVKGYSLTFDVEGGDLPRIPVIDDAMHAAAVPIGQRLRLVGTAEFAGFDYRIRPERIANLAGLLQQLYPRIAARTDPAKGVAWTGFRPMSADGLPFIGAAGIPGLFVNAGHGHLGWTLAAGAARLVLDAVTGSPSAIEGRSFDPARRGNRP